MKLAEKTVEVQSNMQFDESVAVSIDESAVSMVIERLISAYKNPYRAALREYTSNAYDEHIASGQKAPVEVSLPSALSPVLKIQDFGRGLNREELKGFGTIGMSTKRDSNEFTGGFGMGSKCALAAASQFTVVSVKNGKRNTVIVARDEHNVPFMNFLAETDTDDESGTTVIIPISDIEKFGDLTDFFVGWKRGSILIDGEEPKRSVYDHNDFKPLGGGIAYDDNLNVSSGQYSVRILINQVYYVLDYRTLGLTHNQWSLLKYKIIVIENGTVDIAPSREDLLYNARTKAALSARFESVLSIAAKDMIESISNAPSLREALALREKMRGDGFPVDTVKWKGRGIVLPGETVKGNRVPACEGTWASPSLEGSSKTGYRVDKTWASLARQKVWLKSTAYNRFVIIHSAGDYTTYGTHNNRKAHREAFGVAEYLQSIDSEKDYNWEFFITSEPLSRVNRIYRDLADSVLSAEEFNSEVSKLRAAARAAEKALDDAKKAHRKLKLLVNFGYGYGSPTRDVEAGDLKDEYNYVIILRNQAAHLEGAARDTLTTKKYYSSSRVQSINTLVNKYKAAVILAGKNEDLSTYQSVLPPITTLDELAAQHIKESIKDKSVLELMAARDINKYHMGAIRNINSAWIKDIKSKATREWIEAVRGYVDTESDTRNRFNWMSGYSEIVRSAMNGDGVKSSKTSLPDSPMKRYPLLEWVSSYNAKSGDIIDYINMADAAYKAKAKSKA